MIIVLKPGTEEARIQELVAMLEALGVIVQRNNGVDYTVLALIGDTTQVSQYPIETNDIVHKVVRIQEPFKRANRLFHPPDTVIRVGGHEIGGGQFVVAAGPCAVESEKHICEMAQLMKAAGAHFLRGGAFKPRSSPYSFQGLGKEGLTYLARAGRDAGIPVVTEIMSIDMIDEFVKNVDIIQVGTRNMQNFTLLRELGRIDKPILLKRGMSATIEEWLMSAEYIISEGNENVILCERGIRTFENYTRNTLDIGAVPVVKRLSHLPVLVDPSHASGIWWMVEPLARAAVVAGADGLLVEVHTDPKQALSDGNQSIKPQKFDRLMKEIEVLASIMGRPLRAPGEERT
ncbi:MAG: 3-deoxy-7-phosphoheptulonate synthase [Clostridiales bacterium]|nr:3-deoxy-7-phosphoheptulonate synthase [Clostridiales bacterium]